MAETLTYVVAIDDSDMIAFNERVKENVFAWQQSQQAARAAVSEYDQIARQAKRSGDSLLPESTATRGVLSNSKDRQNLGELQKFNADIKDAESKRLQVVEAQESRAHATKMRQLAEEEAARASAHLNELKRRQEEYNQRIKTAQGTKYAASAMRLDDPTSATANTLAAAADRELLRAKAAKALNDAELSKAKRADADAKAKVADAKEEEAATQRIVQEKIAEYDATAATVNQRKAAVDALSAEVNRQNELNQTILRAVEAQQRLNDLRAQQTRVSDVLPTAQADVQASRAAYDQSRNARIAAEVAVAEATESVTLELQRQQGIMRELEISERRLADLKRIPATAEVPQQVINYKITAAEMDVAGNEAALRASLADEAAARSALAARQTELDVTRQVEVETAEALTSDQQRLATVKERAAQIQQETQALQAQIGAADRLRNAEEARVDQAAQDVALNRYNKKPLTISIDTARARTEVRAWEREAERSAKDISAAYQSAMLSARQASSETERNYQNARAEAFKELETRRQIVEQVVLAARAQRINQRADSAYQGMRNAGWADAEATKLKRQYLNYQKEATNAATNEQREIAIANAMATKRLMIERGISTEIKQRGKIIQPVEENLNLAGGTLESDAAAFTAQNAAQRNAALSSTTDKINNVGSASKKSSRAVRDLVIEFRSVGSILAGASWEGALYYVSQVGRNLEGAALGFAGAATAAALFGLALIRLTQAGAKAQSVSNIYANLTSSMGVEADALVDKLQNAAQGTLTFTQAMTVANRSMLAGGAQLANELPQLMEISRAAALATGQDITYVFDSLVKGIVKGSPKLIDNADIYLKIGDATRVYAAEVGKSVTQLSAQERQQATLNAVLKDGSRFIKDVGADAKLAAEDIKTLEAAVQDAKDTFGLILVELGFTKSLSDLATYVRARSEYQRVEAEGNRLVKDGNLPLERRTELMKLIRQFGLLYTTTAAPTAESVARQEQYNALLAASVDEYERIGRAAQIARFLESEDPEVRQSGEQMAQYDMIDRGSAAWRASGEAIDEAQAALKAYNQAIDEGSGELKQAKQLEDVAKQIIDLRKLMVGLPKMPEIGDTLLTVDTDELRAWAAEMQKEFPDNARSADNYVDSVIAVAEAFEVEQAAVLTNIALLETADQRIQAFANSYFGFGASVEEVISGFDKFSPRIKQAVLDFGLVKVALNDLTKQRREPVTFDVQFKGVEDALKSVDDLALKISAAGGGDAARQFRAQAEAAILSFAQGLETGADAVDQQMFNEMTQALLQPWEQLAKDMEARYAGLRTIQDDLLTISRNVPKAPEIGDSVLTTDVAALNAYLNRLSALEPSMRPAIAATQAYVDALAREQQAVLAVANTLDDPAAALAYLTTKLGLATGGIEALLAAFKSMPASVAAGISSVRLFGLALDNLIAKTRQPITLDLMVEDAAAGIQDIQQATLGLTEYIQPEQLLTIQRNMVEAYVSDMRALGKRETAINKDEWDIRAKVVREHYTKIANESQSYYEGLKSKSKDATKALKKDAGEMRSAIEAALKKGLEVSSADILSTKAGTYEDKAMESARRLNAIAERGFEELKKHPDWAEALMIPPDILAGSEAQLKAWAAQTSEDVQNFLRPDLINWDAFADAYQKNIDDVEARAYTMDYALSELKKRGLIEPGKEGEARKKLEKMFGVPEVTFKSMFPEATSGDPAMNSILKFLRDDKALEIDYKFVLEGDEKSGLPATGAPDQPSYDPLSSATRKIRFNAVIATLTPEELATMRANIAAQFGASPAEIATALAAPTPEAAAALLTEVATQFSATPVQVATTIGWTVDDTENYRTGLQAYFSDNPINVNTVLGGTLEDYQLFREGQEGAFLDNPINVNTAMYMMEDGFSVYRNQIEGYFQEYPIYVATTLTPPEDMPWNGYGGEEEREANFKVPGLARMLPANYAENMARDVDMTKPGQDIAGKLYTSFAQAARAQTPGMIVANAWGRDFLEAAPLWDAVGQAAGTRTAMAFQEAMVQGVGNIRRRLAEIIAPEVAEILNAKGKAGSLT